MLKEPLVGVGKPHLSGAVGVLVTITVAFGGSVTRQTFHPLMRSRDFIEPAFHELVPPRVGKRIEVVDVTDGSGSSTSRSGRRMIFHHTMELLLVEAHSSELVF
jgi:hypothetical protein